MLPYRKTTGREAFKGLKVYVGVPQEFEDAEVFKVQDAQPKNIKKA